MAWIESHQTLGQHPKTRKLARLLNISVPTAVGHLQFLWWWAMDYAPDGSLERFEDADIADAMLWEGNAEALVDALRIAGFVDVNQIHDWDTYLGRLIDRRAANAERARESRERARSVRATNAQRATLPNTTQHNRTEPNPTEPLGAKAPARTRGVISLTSEERERLRTKWEPKLPDWKDVLSLALSHESHKKYPTNQYGYADNWLRRECEMRAERNKGNGSSATQTGIAEKFAAYR